MIIIVRSIAERIIVLSVDLFLVEVLGLPVVDRTHLVQGGKVLVQVFVEELAAALARETVGDGQMGTHFGFMYYYFAFKLQLI